MLNEISANKITIAIIKNMLNSKTKHDQDTLNQALSNLKEILKEEPRNYEVLYLRGLIYRKLEKYQLAIADLNLSLTYEIQENGNVDAAILFDIAYCYLQLKEYQQASERFTAFIISRTQMHALTEQDKIKVAQAFQYRAFLNNESNLQINAISDYQKSLEYNDQNETVYLELAELYQLSDMKNLQLLTLNDGVRQLNTVALLQARANYYFTEHKNDQALKDYRNAIKQEPKNKLLHYDFAEMLQTIENLIEAKKEFEMVLSLKPADKQLDKAAKLALKSIEEKQKEQQEKQKKQQKSENIIHEIRIHRALHNHKKIITICKSLSKNALADKVTLSLLGLSYFQLQEFDNAIEPLEKAVKAGANSAIVFNALGFCYLQKYQNIKDKDKDKKFYTLSVEYLTRAIEKKSPFYTEAYYNRSKLYALNGDKAASEQDLIAAANIAKEIPNNRYHQETILLTRELEIDQDNFDALYQRGISHLELGIHYKLNQNDFYSIPYFKNAEEDFNKFIKAGGYAYRELAATYFYMKDYKQALKTFNKVDDMHDHAISYLQRGICYWHEKNIKNAIDDLAIGLSLGLKNRYPVEKEFFSDPKNLKIKFKEANTILETFLENIDDYFENGFESNMLYREAVDYYKKISAPVNQNKSDLSTSAAALPEQGYFKTATGSQPAETISNKEESKDIEVIEIDEYEIFEKLQ